MDFCTSVSPGIDWLKQCSSLSCSSQILSVLVLLHVFLFYIFHNYSKWFREWMCQIVLNQKLFCSCNLTMSFNFQRYWIFISVVCLCCSHLFWVYGLFINEIKLYYMNSLGMMHYELWGLLTQIVENCKIRNQNSWIFYIWFACYNAAFS